MDGWADEPIIILSAEKGHLRTCSGGRTAASSVKTNNHPAETSSRSIDVTDYTIRAK